MSAEILRKAAALMRERAEGATPGPWDRGDIDRFDEGSFTVDYADVEPNVCGGIDPADAEHIASMHPTVALAVADWLEDALDAHLHIRPGNYPSYIKALAVARTYLGSDA